jgi:23S rRNA pseudouridine1911/1915/1917 synthase
MKPLRLVVPRHDSHVSLLDFLSRSLKLSRRKAKALLDARNVFVNRRRVWMARHPLRPDDVVECVTSEAPRPASRVTVLWEDDDYLVVNKPPGILSNGDDSIEDTLRTQLAMPSLRAVHRLDRDTSGCLLLAKTGDAMERMLPLFRAGEVRKTYHALAAGRLDPPAQTVTRPIDGQRAVTHLRTLDSSGEASHLLVAIETGRTHQIRKHLASLGTPLLGDRSYATASEVSARGLRVPRQMLHASDIAFRNPRTRQSVRVQAPLPPDFCRCLAGFRLA